MVDRYECDVDCISGVDDNPNGWLCAYKDYQKLESRIKILEDALRSMLEVCKDPKSYDFVKVSEIIRTALEVKP